MNGALLYAFRHMTRRPKESLLLGLVVFVAATMCLSQLAQRRGVERRARTVLVEALAGAFLLDHGAAEAVDVLTVQPATLMPVTLTPMLSRFRESGFDVTPRLRFGALIGRGSKSVGVVVHALADSHMRRTASILGIDDPEAALHTAGPHATLMSAEIATALGVSVGDTLAVLATNRSGYTSDGIAVVAAVFSARGAAAFLVGVVFAAHADGAALLGLRPGETLELVAHPLAREWGDADARTRIGQAAGSLRVTSWDDAAPLLAAVLAVWRAGGVVTQAVLASMAFLLVLNAMLAKLHDRTVELGTLRAMGVRIPQILAMISLEYVLIVLSMSALAAMAVALAVQLVGPDGIPLKGEALQAAYMGSRLIPIETVSDVLWVTALLLGVVLLATVAPLVRVLRQPPSSLLRVRT